MKTKVYRVAIHNQIYFTKYFHITEYFPAKNGGWLAGESFGYRGKGGHLGMNFSEAIQEARKLNSKEGWTEQDSVKNSKGKILFNLYV